MGQKILPRLARDNAGFSIIETVVLFAISSVLILAAAYLLDEYLKNSALFSRSIESSTAALLPIELLRKDIKMAKTIDMPSATRLEIHYDHFIESSATLEDRLIRYDISSAPCRFSGAAGACLKLSRQEGTSAANLGPAIELRDIVTFDWCIRYLTPTTVCPYVGGDPVETSNVALAPKKRFIGQFEILSYTSSGGTTAATVVQNRRRFLFLVDLENLTANGTERRVTRTR